MPDAHFALLADGETTTARVGARKSGGAVSPRFPFVSVTKLFTATLAMQLVADGDLELDVPIGQYGADFAAVPTAGAHLTLRHLLSHTSGLVCDHDGDTLSAGRYTSATAAQELLFAPGSAFSYSNAGFVLVGRLVERVTGTDWADAVSTFLLRPLGIEPSFVPGLGVTAGHTRTRGGLLTLETTVPAALAPAAALAGTVEDLVRFARLHLDRRERRHSALLDAHTVARMRAAVPGAVPFGLAEGWGLGWGRYGAPDRPWFGLDGAGAGTTCNLRVEPEGGTVAALLTNSSAGTQMWREVAALLHAEGVPVGMPPQRRAAAGPDTLAAKAGAWTNGDTTYLVAAGRHGEVHLEDDDAVRYVLEAGEDGEFSAYRTGSADLPYLGRFLPDPSTGSTDLMQFSGRVLRRELNFTGTRTFTAAHG